MRQHHGKKGTRVYSIWQNMLNRCRNEKTEAFKNYGGRGIKVCERWKTLTGFVTDMGEPPTDKHTLERINNDGSYEPGNCRWATHREQCYNKRNTRHFTVDGVTLSVAEWCQRTGLSYSCLFYRIRNGWPKELVFGAISAQKFAFRGSEIRCKNGHLYSESNEYRDSRGRRGCKTCRKIARDKHRKKSIHRFEVSQREGEVVQ
jgi:hypothetical protein